MSHEARRIFRNLLLIAALAFGLIAGATVYGGHGLLQALERFNKEALPDHERAERALEVAIEFKWQVQEWKNLLLRSSDSSSTAEHWLTVQSHEQAVQAGLQAMFDAAAEEDRPDIFAAIQAHHALGQVYAQAKVRFEVDGFRPQRVDASIRGADRPLLAALDVIADRAVKRAKRTDAEAEASAKQALWLAMLGLGLGTLAGVVSFFVMIRRAVLRPTEQVFTQLAATSEALLQSERLASLGRLAAGMAHEIKTPVASSLSCATDLQRATQALSERLAAGPLTSAAIQDYFQQAASSSELLAANARVVEQLMRSLEQVAADQTGEARRKFRLRAYLLELIQSLQSELKRSAMQIDVRCPDGIEMDSYPGALAQVLTQLLLNAQRHAFEEGVAGLVAIEVSQVGEQLEMSITDKGRGIAPEHLNKVFDPFFTTQRQAGGSGLGLNRVHQLLTHTLGGQVQVRSQLGQGTQFLITLPRVAPPLRESPPTL